MDDNIEGKVVVITGASSGLGEAAARLLAEKGAKLVLGARRKERIDALVQEIAASGGSAEAVATDVTARVDVEALVGTAVERFGRVDVMINNAGVMLVSPVERLKVEDWDRMIDVNIKGVLYGIAAVLPVMQRQKSGHLINVSSVAGHKVRPTSAIYSATKHAVRALSEGVRQELKAYNIRSTIISPGAVATELVDRITEDDIREAAQPILKMAIPADSFARCVAFAISQPDDVDINEILFRPTAQEY
jgi:NADP-dependent 3-hydroxy acid dehydrogenase YdfG